MTGKGAAIGVGIGALGLLALIGVASAKSKGGNGVPSPTEDPFSTEACNAYKQARGQVATARAAAQADITEINAAIIAAEANGDQAQAANLYSIRAQVQQAISGYNAQINELDSKIAQC